MQLIRAVKNRWLAPFRSLNIPLPECNLSYANGIWLADLDADAWKLKVHHGVLQPFGTVDSLALFTPARDEAGREKWQRHQNYAGHILSEEWQKQPNGTYRWVPEGSPGKVHAASDHVGGRPAEEEHRIPLDQRGRDRHDLRLR